MPSKKRMKIDAPAALRPLNIKPKTFLTRNKQYADLTVASFVFYPPKFDLIRRPPFNFITDKGLASNAAWNAPIEPARLLLLQRTPTDIGSPDLWEVPWGGCEATDRTILHSVKRVMFDRTGLHLKRLLKQIGEGEESKSGEDLYIRLCFEIEITEMAVPGIGICAALSDIRIQEDTDEHQDSIWVTEEDIKDDIFPLVVPQQKEVILQAFLLRRATEEEVRAQAVKESRARKQAYYGLKEDEDGEEEEDEDEEDDEDEDQDQDEGIFIPKHETRKRLANKS